MQERFDSIATVTGNHELSDGVKLDIIYKIANGSTMTDLIIEAGRAALGLE